MRTICPECKESFEPPSELLDSLRWERKRGEKIQFYRGKGCIHCKNTGFQGRTGLFEMLEMKPSVRKLVFEGASEEDIRQETERLGLQTLQQDGFCKVREGVTTVEEVIGSHIQE